MKIVKDKISNYNLMQAFYDKTLNNINCHQIGKIEEFNPLTQTATIQIQHINEYKGELFTPVILKDVPVFIYGTPNAYITMPDLVGCTCIILVMDRNIDAFLQTGEMYQPTTTRQHDITDCIALCTFKTQIDAIQNYDNEAITLFNQKIIEEDEKQKQYNSFIKNYGNSIILNRSETIDEETTNSNINITDKINLSTEKSQVNISDKIELKTEQAQINIDDKINIQNQNKNLATLIDTLITTCENIVTVNNDSIKNEYKQNFENLRLQFKELLK